MPLPDPAPRKLLHTRTIICSGFEREDGLWDIEGHLTDVKTYSHLQRHGGRSREPGEHVHDMFIRMTVDLDMLIHDVVAVTDSGPYSVCGDITPNFKRLKGVTIGRGWRREIDARLGGVEGCTHIRELLGPVATTAFQATVAARDARTRGQPLTSKPYQIDSCHAYRDGGPAARERWPQLYADSKPADID
jgi:hypothetical protein